MKKAIGVVCSLAMVANYALPVYALQAEDPVKQLIADIAKGKYTGQENLTESESTAGAEESTFIKISHPENPGNKMEHDPTESEEKRKLHEETEVWPDGLLDYVGNGVLKEPKLGVGPKENPGDRSQSYSWTGIAYGDWMYVSTQFNSSGLTGDLMGTPVNPEQTDKSYGGDYFAGVKDGGEPGNTLTKINVKTGEVKNIMSISKNGLNAQFRNSVEYKGKLYFCGSVNHVPSIYEVDPTNDAFKCVYQDPSMVNYPGGLSEAWKVARNERLICPTIRGLTVFGDYLVISCVGLDENPYIAITDDPDEGFHTIARTWKDPIMDEDGKFISGTPAELLGYPACHIPDSIFGGSIWEMAEVDGKLYVAMCTGTPEIARKNGHTHMEPKLDALGNETDEQIEVIDEMQSFALIRGELKSADADPLSMDSWVWTPVAGAKEDGALYPFGIDEERTRAGACNLVKYNGKLYIGEYNDTQIAFQNMQQKQFTFLKENLEQSVSLYRMDFDENGNEVFVKIMGDPTTRFPNTVSGEHTASGFGTEARAAKETQYIWQSKVYDGKLYLGTFDETMILNPLIKEISQQMQQVQNMMEEVASLSTLADEEKDEETIALYNSVEKKVKKDTKKGLLNHLEQFFDAKTNPSMLPAEIVESHPIVKVDSIETLYEALLKADQLSKANENVGIREEAANVSQYIKLHQEVCTYLNETEDEMPSTLQGAAETFAGDENLQSMYEEVQFILDNMKGAIAGFDMHVTSDGIHFDKITVNGFGDPYNQGLRAFAANNSADNQWMAIGTANAFYGTSIWRKEDLKNPQPVDPDQHEVTLKFVNAKTNKEVKNALDQADTIYVNKKKDGSLEAVVPQSIEQLLPTDHTFVDPNTPVFVDGDVVTFQVNADVKDVIVHFQGEDESETLATSHVQILRSKENLTYEDLIDILPEGYTVKDPSLKNEIVQNDEEQNVVNVQIVKGQDATILNGKASINKTELKASKNKKLCIAPTSKVTILADEKEGTEFYKWKIDSKNVVLEDEYTKSTTFVMPNEEVEIEAIYKGSADKQDLLKAIQEAENIDTSKYTEESVEVFELALQEAKEINEDSQASQEDILSATQSLVQATQNLQEKESTVNKEALVQAIAVALDKDVTIYTSDTVQPFEEALQRAQEVNENLKASQEEVDRATQTLEEATSQLVQKPGTVNKEMLRKVIREAQAKDKTLYTLETVQPFEEALQKAQKVNEDLNASQEEVDYATQTLLDCMHALKEKGVNKDKLASWIDQAERIDPSEYTKASYDHLQEVLKQAKVVYENELATQEDVDTACQMVSSALDHLVKETVNKQRLVQLIEEAESKDSTLYTKESFQRLQSALEKAKVCNQSHAMSQKEVDDACQMLYDAIQGLVSVENVVDKSELQQVIAEAEAKNPDVYTEDSYKKMQVALNQAKIVNDDVLASQKEVDEAMDHLKNRMKSLEEKQSASGTSVSTHVFEYVSLAVVAGVLFAFVKNRLKKTNK